MRIEPSSDAMIELLEREQEMLEQVVQEWHCSGSPTAQWQVVPAARLIRIWKDAAELGFVRDESGLARIAELMVENVLRISVNNLVSGHQPATPEDVLDGLVEPADQEAFVDWAINTETGGWRISDYGIEPLFKLAALLTETNDPMQKLAVVDRMLNVVHPRSDLASWFVEGGSRTLLQLSEDERPSTPTYAVP